MEQLIKEPRSLPKQQRSRDRAEAIVQATRDLLVEVGIGEINTKRIAKKAGVPIGAVYYLYPNKFSIYKQLFEQYSKTILSLATPEEELTIDNWEQQLDTVIDALSKFWMQEKAFTTLWDAYKFTPELKEQDQLNLSHLMGNCVDFIKSNTSLTQQEITIVSHTLIGFSDRLMMDIVTFEKRSDQIRAREELKLLVKLYLKHYVAIGTGVNNG